MRPSIWSSRTLLWAWLVALGLVALSQTLSALLFPRSWDFAVAVWTNGSGITESLGVARRVWLELWRQRPFDAVAVAALMAVLAFTAVWAPVRLWHALRNRGIIVERT